LYTYQQPARANLGQNCQAEQKQQAPTPKHFEEADIPEKHSNQKAQAKATQSQATAIGKRKIKFYKFTNTKKGRPTASAH